MKYRIILRHNTVWVQPRVAVLDHWPAITESEAIEITDWVARMSIGHRVAYDRWNLNSKQAVMMFMLRWQ